MQVWICATLMALGACTAEGEPATEVARANGRPVVELAPHDRVASTDCDGIWAAAATGRVVDSNANPVQSANVGLCVVASGTGICLPPTTTASGGWFSYVLGSDSRCLDKLIIHTEALTEPSRHLADSYCQIALDPKNGVLDIANDQVLAELDIPSSLPTLGNPKAPHRVTFANGIELSVMPDDLIEGAEYARLGASVLNPQSSYCFIPNGLHLDGLAAFGPGMNVNVLGGAPAVEFKLPNSSNLAEGTQVDLYVLGGVGSRVDAKTPIEEGAFVRYGVGYARGKSIIPDARSGLPALTFVGYKKAI